MKKTYIFLFLLLSVLSFSLFKYDSFSNDNFLDTKLSTKVDEKHYFSNGSYIVITLETLEFTELSNNNIIKGFKSATAYDSKDKILWEFHVFASFLLNEGISSLVLETNYSYKINNNKWKFSNGESFHNNNVAEAKGIMKQKVLFITTKTVDIHLKLTSDIYGNIT